MSSQLITEASRILNEGKKSVNESSEIKDLAIQYANAQDEDIETKLKNKLSGPFKKAIGIKGGIVSVHMNIRPANKVFAKTNAFVLSVDTKSGSTKEDSDARSDVEKWAHDTFGISPVLKTFGHSASYGDKFFRYEIHIELPS